MTKKKIAVLGGGVGALSAAFALSETDPEGQRFDITVYQLGWRLGGKTANGRNAEYGERIEEHGLHIWAGFYENAFTILRAALKALGRPKWAPQSTIDKAFLRQNHLFLTESFDEQWLPWPVWFEPDADPSLYPGRDSLFTAPGSILPDLGTLMVRAFALIEFNWLYYRQVAAGSASLDPGPSDVRSQVDAMTDPDLAGTRALVERLSQRPNDEALRLASIAALEAMLGQVLAWLDQSKKPEWRRYLLMMELSLRIMIGGLLNRVLRHGLHVIDRFEFRDFLAQAAPLTHDNPLVSALYDYAFAYRDGKTPEMSACGAVQGLVRLFLTYKGGFFYKASAGMGDTICTPIYEVLKSRGVRFHFFHQVQRLNLDETGYAIGSIDMLQQAELAPGVDHYAPLTIVNGLGCWPSEPHWDQLADGARLKAEGINFEDLHSPQPPGTAVRLERGDDFDEVVLGISLGSLPEICAPLIAASPDWKAMVDNLGTTATQAFQLWLDCPAPALGGAYTAPISSPPLPGRPSAPDPMGPIVTGYQKPFDTYADMSHLLSAEAWPLGRGPRSVAYFCSTLPDPDADKHDQKAADARVRQNALQWMHDCLPVLWPRIDGPNGFDWDRLYAADAVGEARFDRQFWQANINLSERYVLALPGTLQYRLEPSQSGFQNLYLAGDWTRVPEINAGCVEVAAMSGILAASALSGIDIPVAAGDTLYARPEFIDYGGWVSLPPPPSMARDATFFSWPLPAAPGALQDYLDRSLNRAIGRREFRPAFDLVFLSMVHIGRLGSAIPSYAEEGVMTETDVGFWILVERYAPGADSPTGFGFVPACLLVDNPYAMASGREIWGYPKYAAEIRLPEDAIEKGQFTASAWVIDRFAPGTPAGLQPLVSVSPTGEPQGRDVESAIGGLDQLRQAAALVAGRPGSTPVPAAGIPSLPDHVFYLKQFRAADSSTEACYRRVLRGALTPEPGGSWSLLEGNWSITLRASDSLPFIRDLGLGVPQDGPLVLKAGLALRAELDFIITLAQELD